MSDKKRILLIDNEEGLCRMMEAVLLDNCYSVKAYTRSFQAVEEFVPGEWDLVITDIKMPGMDGLEVLQRIKQKQPQIPVIMITAYGGVESYLEAMNLGAFEYINKPVKIDELKLILKKVLRETVH